VGWGAWQKPPLFGPDRGIGPQWSGSGVCQRHKVATNTAVEPDPMKVDPGLRERMARDSCKTFLRRGGDSGGIDDGPGDRYVKITDADSVNKTVLARLILGTTPMVCVTRGGHPGSDRWLLDSRPRGVPGGRGNQPRATARARSSGFSLSGCSLFGATGPGESIRVGGHDSRAAGGGGVRRR